MVACSHFHLIIKMKNFNSILLRYSGSYVGNVPANTRLKIPAINLEDGPQGVADGVKEVTCWPSSLAVAASWDLTLVNNWAAAMAAEQKAKGTNVMLGPDINIARVPVGGRIFEMFGEDPTLTATLVVESVNGIQSQQVVATAKHYIDNDQEYERVGVSVEIDERTQHEMYYPQFQAAINAGVGAVMCSYNKINGSWACEQPQTLSDLKNGMGFQGWVMSDWGATHSTVAAANAGLDQEMPSDTYFGSALAQAVTGGQVPQSRLDDMVTRILTGLYMAGAMDNTAPTGNLGANVTSAAHNKLALTLAQNAIALLQNTGNILPLSPNGKTFAILGDAGSVNPTIAGGGSGHVIAPYVVAPLAGIQARVGSAGKVSYAQTNPIATAVDVAKAADYAIVFVGFTSSEGSDRANLSLPEPQDSLISAVAAANPNTIVVLNGPGPVLMPWASSVKAILFGFFPGQESGNAIASVLFGDFNPSAKLPVSFPVKENDWFTGSPNQYPGVNSVVQYSEKLLVGYRWYDNQNIAPLFPFGHGLSYTTFGYSNLQISGSISSGLTIKLTLQNTGHVNGSEVVQLYLSYPPSAGEPPQVLRKFQKLFLAPGSSEVVTFNLAKSDISIYDISSSSFVAVSGTFNINIGSSSRDIRLKGFFTA
jgi:beta-glucosidase